MGWKSLGYAIAPTMQKSQPTHKGVARITTYVHLCLKSQYTATFVSGSKNLVRQKLLLLLFFF